MIRIGFLVGLTAFFLAFGVGLQDRSEPRAGFGSVAHASDDAGSFIMNLADRAIGALTDPSLDDSVRAERFRELVRDSLDVDFIAGRVLGPYVRRATDMEMAEFRNLLEENIVRKYSVMFKSYSGQKIELLDTKEGSRESTTVSILVHSTDGAPPSTVRWIVHEVDGKNKIIDIVVERASMVTTQKEEFVSVIRRGGGKVEALLQELRERNAELAQSRS
ncbi:ABC transporter substrate-binding protein [Rhodospirillaceae bacterium KN72]|uniref:ABC transporter substrate-binding protein n=1 Tax=Pacificispira spongiicola TaxID=2729598 RepID=A0A7Y0DZP2_9PROT|nr:ABC transporter substrate-binding protein [Pacificispira spongiicola]NMM43801.1 ABC transporter substrate-binding protein [Pacificispira spongiicola]